MTSAAPFGRKTQFAVSVETADSVDDSVELLEPSVDFSEP